MPLKYIVDTRMTIYALFSIFSSGGHFFSAEPKHFSNFGKGALEEHFSEIKCILKSGHWPRKSRLKGFL